MTLVVVLALLLPTLVFPASAAFDYNDLNPSIAVDGDNNLVTITVPKDAIKLTLNFYGSGDNVLRREHYCFSTYMKEEVYYNLFIDAFWEEALDITNIPNNTTVSLNYTISGTEQPDGWVNPQLRSQIWYYNDRGVVGSDTINQRGDQGENFYPLFGTFTHEMIMDKMEGSTEASFRVVLFKFLLNEPCLFNFSVDSFKLTFSISSLYLLQQQTGKTNELLEVVEKKLEQNGQKLDDILDRIEQNGDKLDGIGDKLDDTNDKLDDTNDKLDELPGEIGDAIQGVIDNEKQEAESSGNKFVDQILGALPDPSTEVLSALKGLTDATSYIGTDAVLPIPAIVLPEIDGLFPETVIWEGAELDFAEYMNFLPPALLSLVRSLFTIAIVLFCVYELKGIISYCLTLRENKGG